MYFVHVYILKNKFQNKKIKIHKSSPQKKKFK